MRTTDLQYLVCPTCHEDLRVSSIDSQQDNRLETAQLKCTGCQAIYPVVRGIPRFVPDENYATNFGFEWNLHARTQYDSYSGLKLSETRFFEQTRWPRDLSGQLILEVGSGSGRFTEQAAATGAFVVSMDYSFAVEANYRSNGQKPNVLIVQADIYHMPFRSGTYDKLFCFGMLQHTPDVHKSFQALPPMLKPGGELVVDVYRKSFLRSRLQTATYVRPLTCKIPPERLYRLTKRWVDLMWPLCSVIRKIPRYGCAINFRLLVADHGNWGLKGDMLKEWAYLDTFDLLSPRYDSPQTLATVRHWYDEAGFTEVDVANCDQGIVGRGKKPAHARSPRTASSAIGHRATAH